MQRHELQMLRKIGYGSPRELKFEQFVEHTCATRSESLRAKAPQEVGQRTGIVDFQHGFPRKMMQKLDSHRRDRRVFECI